MTATPYIPGDKFQKIIVQLQDSGGQDHDSGNPVPVKVVL